MNNFNKILNGKGMILLVFGMLLALFPWLWTITDQQIDNLSFWSALSTGALFFLLGLYELIYFKKGQSVSFLIKKGKHYCKQRFLRLFTGNKITADVKLNTTMMYRTNKIDDLNKIFGFSSGLYHLRHSARFAWKPSDDGKKIEIWSYVRYKGLLDIDHISDYKPGAELHMSIHEDKGSGYSFYIYDGKEYHNHIVEVEKSMPLLRYMLWPYFGGDYKSPRNIIFNLTLA